MIDAEDGRVMGADQSLGGLGGGGEEWENTSLYSE